MDQPMNITTCTTNDQQLSFDLAAEHTYHQQHRLALPLGR
jgi:hypothetical protein